MGARASRLRKATNELLVRNECMTQGKASIPGFLQNLDMGARASRMRIINKGCDLSRPRAGSGRCPRYLFDAGGMPALPGQPPYLRYAGFSLLELLIVLAILAILVAFAIFGIGSARAGMLADRAMYQVMTSLREARMLAMRNNWKMSVDFDSGSGEIHVYAPAGSAPNEFECGWNISPTWAPIPDSASDPSTRLENGYFYTGSHWGAGEYPFGKPFEDITGGSFPNVFASATTGTITNLLFTADGFFTEYDDHCSPKDKVIFIDSPGADPGSTMNRAVTILGVTGRIDGWRLKNNGKWENVK